MDTYTIVRPEHLNHYGYLFGGQLLKWVDEHAWLVAAREYPGYPLVTRAMDQIDFKTRVANGSILRFRIDRVRAGNTSVSYAVEVFADEPGRTDPDVRKRERHVFSTTVTFAPSCVARMAPTYPAGPPPMIIKFLPLPLIIYPPGSVGPDWFCGL